MKLHIQLEPFTGRKFDFIEIEVEKVAQIPQVYTKLEELKGAVKAPDKKAPSEFVSPNEKQLGLVKRLGGDLNKKFKSWEEFSNYIDELKKPKATAKETKPSQVAAGDMPWAMDL